MRFKILTFDTTKAQRGSSIVDADNAEDARYAVETPTIHVMGVVSLSILDRIAQRERERAERKLRPSGLSMRRINRRLEYALTRKALNLPKDVALNIEPD